MTTTIYVPLLDEGTEVWRPAEAEHMDGEKYRIVSSASADEKWRFNKGEIVRVRARRLSGEDHLAADSLA
jgi:hypothetical protein